MEMDRTNSSVMKKYCLSKYAIVLLVIIILFLFGRRMLKTNVQMDKEPQTDTKVMPMDSIFHRISDFKVMYNMPDLKLYIYTSYLDQRFNQPVLRIFGIEQKGGIGVDFKCTWKHTDGSTNEAVAKRYWIDTSWPDWSPYYACEYNCPIPKTSSVSDAVLTSLDMKHTLKLPLELSNRYRSHRREDMALCIKPFSGYLGTPRLVEWLETLQALGYKQVIIYNSDITGPGRHVIQYYKEKGIVTVIDFPYLISVIQNVESPSLSAEERYATYQQIYLVAMHDCLYRFSGLYRYIAFHDFDEIIVPNAPSETVQSMLQRAEVGHPSAGGFLFYTMWHWEDFGPVNATEELYMQRYTKCTAVSKQQPRSIVSTDRVITINFHEILDVPKKDYKSVTLTPAEYGAVHSYKGKCSSKFKNDICGKMLLEEILLDKLVSRYKMQVRYRVTRVRAHLKML